MGLIKIEKNVGRCQKLPPPGLLSRSPFPRRALMVGGVARWPKEVGFIGNPDPGIHPTDSVYVLLLQEAGDEHVDLLTLSHRATPPTTRSSRFRNMSITIKQNSASGWP